MPIFGSSGAFLVLGDRDPHTPYTSIILTTTLGSGSPGTGFSIGGVQTSLVSESVSTLQSLFPIFTCTSEDVQAKSKPLPCKKEENITSVFL